MSSRLSTEKNNYSRYHPDDLLALLDEIRQTIDEEESNKLWEELFAIYNADTPIIPLYAEQKIIGVNKNLYGIQMSQVGAHEFQNAVVVEE